MTKISPLALATLMRHAFMSGAGYGELQQITKEHQDAWVAYEPPEPLFRRVHDALYSQRGAAIRERSTSLQDAESLLNEYAAEWADRQHISAMNDGLIDDSPATQARDAKIEELKGRILALMS